MNEVFIDIRKENEWIRKYFNTDFVSIDSLLSCIENLDGELETLKEAKQDIEKVKDFYEKREKELLSKVKEFWS